MILNSVNYFKALQHRLIDVREKNEGEVLVSTVPASRIEYVCYNSAGKISLPVIEDVTGDCYTYGLAVSGTVTVKSGDVSVTKTHL